MTENTTGPGPTEDLKKRLAPRLAWIKSITTSADGYGLVHCRIELTHPTPLPELTPPCSRLPRLDRLGRAAVLEHLVQRERKTAESPMQALSRIAGAVQVARTEMEEHPQTPGIIHAVRYAEIG